MLEWEKIPTGEALGTYNSMPTSMLKAFFPSFGGGGGSLIAQHSHSLDNLPTSLRVFVGHMQLSLSIPTSYGGYGSYYVCTKGLYVLCFE